VDARRRLHGDPDALDVVTRECHRRRHVEQRKFPDLSVADLLEIEVGTGPRGRDPNAGEQEGQYERVGEDVTRKVDVRVVAATIKTCKQRRARRFRQDLFYRLNVFPIELPPLRARKDDIPLLAARFVGAGVKEIWSSFVASDEGGR
jgi:Sigma-54 interaction domain